MRSDNLIFAYFTFPEFLAQMMGTLHRAPDLMPDFKHWRSLKLVEQPN